MPKKKTEVYTLQRLLKEAHALLVKYKQIKKDHKLKVDMELTQQKDNRPVLMVYIRYEHVSRSIADLSGLFACAHTPEHCLTELEIAIHSKSQVRPLAPTTGTEVTHG